MVRKKGIVTAVLSACLMLGCFGAAQAQDRDRDRDRDRKCEQKIHKAEAELQKAIRRHGEHSRQAEQRRRQLQEQRERCGHRDHDRDHDRK